MPSQYHLEFISKTLPGMMLRLITDITNGDFFLCSSETSGLRSCVANT